ncbi:25-hydroxycholesterol 7-alpha-hydroxylase [Colletotrichum fructicola]|uniref:25-hydroxycholesterol 7-alpha-hydroxylase n=1 Tax=Colletotrichum fructicola (strain Nara gc5) TaxID=1213859 RepID=L2GI68_COLFN|nr:25-hydroxycholesterol 7-alpha-hydroxylase [Colletotrichum fructicola]KAF4486380.1 25-hydroxycholesterol 7-alpha-hydroxylase [Colletotrichum fructicola Nara gc5]KAF4881234.1 25-hydroxycholesterol 7-alpha-hydroxylase [Colletotrichum fructicola]KAF4894825.1 25-hydroxycholesterol 7-alpha-hydroxylase [Colletotrichum fructicola]KAF4933705.1 25-hydroxycholesterol 7-alpha-hydroxylase [Colletotrichum fructicola]
MSSEVLPNLAMNHLVLAGLIIILPLIFLTVRSDSKDDPPSMAETIPFVSNTFQYMTNSRAFMQRASQALRSKNIVKLRLGPVRVYLIKGGQQVQAMFRKSTAMSSDKFVIMVLKKLQGSPEQDVARFANDKTGRLKIPEAGFENVSEDQRYWHTLHQITTKNLSIIENTSQLASKYIDFLGEALEKQPLGEWSTVRVFEYLRKDMAESAVKSLAGTRLLEINPGFIDQFWKFDGVSHQVLNGLPQWINPKPARERDKLLAMTEKFLNQEFDKFDWNGLGTDTYWEPTFGCGYSRDLQKWTYDQNMTMRTRAGFLAMSIFAVNSNTVPVTTWFIMELLKDPGLFDAVRAEASEAVLVDPQTGKRGFDCQKLVSSPLLQSVYIECMRLHVSIGITREIMEDTVLDGYRLKKGSLIQAPTNLGHQDDDVWARDGHPASEFWAERHVRHIQKVDEITGEVKIEKMFVMAGKPSDFFPFGGGVSMCPGRHFAKQEILLTVATLVTKFDMEILEWTHMDGRKSDRPAKDNEKYFLNAAVPPDCDVRIRWKRLW